MLALTADRLSNAEHVSSGTIHFPTTLESSMPISVIRLILMLVLAFVAFSATAADALFRSGLESSICDTSAAEAEPNDTLATAETVALDPTTASAIICGAI